MTRSLVGLTLLLAACGGAGSTGPQGLDPTVLITNNAPAGDTLFFTWRDGQGIAGAVKVPPGTTSCTKFLAQADSAYFEAHILVGHSAGTYTQPWFDPLGRPAWTMVVDLGGGINVTDVSPTEPC